MTKVIGTMWTARASHRRIATNTRSFAEAAGPSAGTNPEEVTEPAEPTGGGSPAGDGNGVTVESLMVEIQSLKADNAKLKNTNDRLSSESGTLRKQLREKMTAEEKQAEAEAERIANEKAAAEALRKENEILKGTNRYIKMGFDESLAVETATAVYEHDQTTVDANFAKWQASREKAMEARLRAELMASMPEPRSGNQSGVDYSQIKAQAREAGNRTDYIAAALNEARANGFNK